MIRAHRCVPVDTPTHKYNTSTCGRDYMSSQTQVSSSVMHDYQTCYTTPLSCFRKPFMWRHTCGLEESQSAVGPPGVSCVTETL